MMFQGFMFNSREEMREPAAELYALVVASATPQQRWVEVIQELTDNLDKQVSLVILKQQVPNNRKRFLVLKQNSYLFQKVFDVICIHSFLP